MPPVPVSGLRTLFQPNGVLQSAKNCVSNSSKSVLRTLFYRANSFRSCSFDCTPMDLPISAPSLNATKVGTDITP